MKSQTLENSQNVGSAFLDAGYRPVAVQTGGKAPVGARWPERAAAGIFAPQADALNIGLLCTGLRVVDIDVEDEGKVAKIKELARNTLGEAPERYRENSHRVAMLYRAAEGEPGKRRIGASIKGSDAVEILGRGQQLVAYGTHPTGAAIRWRGLNQDGALLSRDALPVVTEAQVEQFLTEAAAIIGAEPAAANGAPTRQLSSVAQSELAALDIDALAAIVAEIPNDARYDDRNKFVGFAHAIAAAFSADLGRGRELFVDWCERWHAGCQKEGEPERVWESVINEPHAVGAEQLLHAAEEAGVDCAAYKTKHAQTIFAPIEAAPAVPVGGKDVEWPAGFRMLAAGLYYFPLGAGKAPFPPLQIAAPFTVVAETRSVSSEDWGIQLNWNDRDGRPHSWSMPRAMVHGDGTAIAAQLESLGLSCTPGREARQRLAEALGGVTVRARRLCVDRAGWHNPNAGNVFVLPGGAAFGPGAAEVVLQSSHAGSGSAFAPVGTLADWNDKIGRYAVGNSRLGLFVCAALAGPLLDVSGESSGGLHLVGKSQSGKSTAAYVAGSVWGRGDRSGQVRSWRATANGLEGVAAECCDTVLILDEIGQADSREVGEIVYGVCNESGKSRAGRTGEARARKTWRTVLLSTGELSLASKMAGGGQRAQAGQEVRLANVPADAGAGLGVFETLRGFDTGGGLSDHLRQASRSTYGTAGRAFVERLAAARSSDPDGLATEVRLARDAFLVAHVPAGADGQVRSVANRFGLIAAAGELAQRWGVLAWPEGEAERAAAVCFAAWLGERGGAGAGEDAAAISQIRAFLESHGESRFTVIGTSELVGEEMPQQSRTIQRAGFRRYHAEGSDFLILPEAWRVELCKGIDAKRAAKVLGERGLLHNWTPRNPAANVNVRGVGKIRAYIVSGRILDIGDEK